MMHGCRRNFSSKRCKLAGCPNAKYAGCREGEARCDDLAPRVHLEWQNAKKRLSCRVVWDGKDQREKIQD